MLIQFFDYYFRCSVTHRANLLKGWDAKPPA